MSGAAWDAAFAVDLLNAAGCDLAKTIERGIAAVDAALKPCPRDQLGDRITLLWMTFMASRSKVDADTASLWMSEYLRLLGDLPQDIAADAFDRAVQTASHNFIPSIGEIRAIAEPLLAERHRQRDRLHAIQRHLTKDQSR